MILGLIWGSYVKVISKITHYIEISYLIKIYIASKPGDESMMCTIELINVIYSYKYVVLKKSNN